MRLHDFIRTNMEEILQAWEDFARTISSPGMALSAEGLRDHAEQMLRAVVVDLQTPQTLQEEIRKSHGLSDSGRSETAAQTHATTRLIAGFSIDQMVSEYRALRSSVLRLWLASIKSGSDFETQDMIRFNEAIDQALAESVASYSRAVEASRNVFLGILGHDLRAPLGAISMGAEMLLHIKELSDRATKVSTQIFTSVKRASHIVSDLLDFTRSQIGPGIPVMRQNIALDSACARIVEEARAYHAHATIVFRSEPVPVGLFDEARMEQAFSNLISNAVTHGDTSKAITVTLKSDASWVEFQVHNWGDPIASDLLPFLFDPMSRYSQHSVASHPRGSGLGLGLHIASQIVMAHGGALSASSTLAEGSTFCMRLPLGATGSANRSKVAGPHGDE